MGAPERNLPAVTAPAEPALLQPTGVAVAEAGRRQPPPMSSRSSAGRAVGVLLIGLGIGLVFVGTMLVGRTPMWARVVLTLAGVALTYQGINRVCRAISRSFDTTFWLSGLWLIIVVLAAVFAPLLPLGVHADTSLTLTDPSYARPDLFSDHPLGTNNFGLDELARVIYGARASLTVALGAVLAGIVIGGGIGLLAGYFRGATDTVIGIFTNALLAFPPLILLLALASVLEPNLRNITIALAVLTIPTNIRIARANTLAYAQREFVLAARSMGAGRRRIVLRELLPNVLLPQASYGMVLISVLIVAEASLSFLGLGVQQPQPSWGNMIAEGLGGVFEQNPHVVLVPGVVLFLTVFAFNLVGEKARSRFDSSEAKL